MVGQARTSGAIWHDMAPSTHNLTSKQGRAIIALLSNRSVEEAAKACNTPVRTLFRWLKDDEFNAAYLLAKRSAFGQAIARLHYFSSAAVTTLGKVMLDPATPPATKVRAADSVLNHTIKVVEEEQLEARVTELERSADQNKPGWRGR